MHTDEEGKQLCRCGWSHHFCLEGLLGQRLGQLAVMCGNEEVLVQVAVLRGTRSRDMYHERQQYA